jgi:hypothetical protein
MWLNLLAIPSAIAAAALEIMAAGDLVASLSDQSVAFTTVFKYHLAALVVGWPAFWRIFPEDYRQHVVTLTALILGFCLPLPVIGPLFLLGFRLIIRREEASYEEASFVVGTRQYLTLPKDEELELEHENPRSVAQILNSNDQNARRAAILALRVVEPKKALPLLQKAIQDSDEQVRLMAQTMFSQIIASLENEVKNLEAEIVDDPHWNKQLLLAEQYHELVYLGLATDETETIYLTRAIELLEDAQSVVPDNTTIRFLLLKCMLRVGQFEKAKRRIQHLDSLGWRSEITAPWLAEIYYMERDWNALRELLGNMRHNDSTASILRGPIEFWLSNQGAKHA